MNGTEASLDNSRNWCLLLPRPHISPLRCGFVEAYTPSMLRLTLLACTLLTTAAQAQWQIQQSNTSASLRGIHSLGNGIAWASGTEGTILRTTDMGQHWQRCATPPAADHLDFRGIQAFDAQTAIVMSSGKGDLSRLYKTTDACQTWKLVFTNPDKEGFWDAIRFDDPNSRLQDHRQEGVLVGDPINGHFVIFSSSDLGQTWHPFAGKQTQAKRNESLFAASNSAAEAMGDAGNLAFVTGGKDGSYFYREDPGGLVLDEWMTEPSLHRVALPFPHSGVTAGAFSLSKRRIDDNSPDFMIVGGDYLKPEDPGYAAFLPAATYSFFVEHQKGEQSLTIPPHGYRSSVTYDPTQKAWITVGPNGTDLSTDDGRNWHPLRPSPGEAPDADRNWNALSLPFVVGPHGRIGLLNRSVINH